MDANFFTVWNSKNRILCTSIDSCFRSTEWACDSFTRRTPLISDAERRTTQALNSHSPSPTKPSACIQSLSSPEGRRPNSSRPQNNHLVETFRPEAMIGYGQEGTVECQWHFSPSEMASLCYLWQETDVRIHFEIVHQLCMFVSTRRRTSGCRNRGPLLFGDRTCPGRESSTEVATQSRCKPESHYCAFLVSRTFDWRICSGSSWACSEGGPVDS
jgi:hypothetical protein